MLRGRPERARWGLRPSPVPQHFLQLEQIGGQLSASLLHSHDTETRATMTMALADDIIAAGQDASCHILRFSLQAPEAKSSSAGRNGEVPLSPGAGRGRRDSTCPGCCGAGCGELGGKWGALEMGQCPEPLPQACSGLPGSACLAAGSCVRDPCRLPRRRQWGEGATEAEGPQPGGTRRHTEPDE